MLCLCAALLKFCFQTDLGPDSVSYYRQGRDFDVSHHRQKLVKTYLQFYALIGQNLTGEFMRKIYAASWNWVILTAEADRVLCQIGMFLTVFFHWMYKMKYSCHKFIGCLVDKCATCQSRESNFGWHHFCFPLCSMWKRVKRSQAILALLDSFQEQHSQW